MIRFIADDKGV